MRARVNADPREQALRQIDRMAGGLYEMTGHALGCWRADEPREDREKAVALSLRKVEFLCTEIARRVQGLP